MDHLLTTDPSDPSPTSVVRDAGAPFNDVEPGLTVFLLSSDRVFFGVYKAILAKASPVFNDIFRLPLPESAPDDGEEQRQGVPIIRMEEDACTLSLALRLLYPTDNPPLKRLRDVKAALGILDKFMVDAFVETLSSALLAHVDAEPLTVYGLACRYRYPSVAATAAKATLSLPLPQDLPLSHGLTPPQAQALQQYRRDCVRKVAVGVLDWARTSAAQVDPSFSLECGNRIHFYYVVARDARNGSYEHTAVPHWWAAYHKDVAEAVQACPRGSAAVGERLLEKYRAIVRECAQCRRSAEGVLARCSAFMEAEIERAVGQVPGPFCASY
ncbi:hypothetical protein OF83DRAFT_1175454 [Amylostereum chailletii]|nr:hypothetical protein OF83DRAFT_1175454 [Amylostereum chailletii]